MALAKVVETLLEVPLLLFLERVAVVFSDQIQRVNLRNNHRKALIIILVNLKEKNYSD